MAGIQNTTLFSQGERLQASSAQDIAEMQTGATDVSRINHTGNPEGVISANPSSLCHDPVSGSVYQKQTGTGNTGWELIGTQADFNPFKVITLVDDFFSTFLGNSADGRCGQLGWQTYGGAWAEEVGTAQNPGVVTPANSANSTMTLNNSDTTGSIQVGGGQIEINYVLKLSALSVAGNRYNYCGLGLVAPFSGIYFTYSDNVNSGNWQIVCSKVSVGTTTTNTSTPAGTGYVNLGIIINAAGTSVEFTIDGSSVGTIATANIPTAAISPIVSFVRSSGALPAALVDLFVLKKTLTTQR